MSVLNETTQTNHGINHQKGVRSALFSSYGAALELALMRNVSDAISEDYGTLDWTGLLVPDGERCYAQVLCRESAVLCGQDWFVEVFDRLCGRGSVQWHIQEGTLVAPGTVVCSIHGPAQAMLAAERPALNFLQTLSAVATKVRKYVDLVAGTKAHILDTRKTLPGLRLAQKYAVRVGGGVNQRLALYDGVLIKENHIAAAGGIAAVLKKVTDIVPSHIGVQIEVESLFELQEALECGAHSILLDNFEVSMLHQAVVLNAGRAILEASGGVSEHTVLAIAQTGVDRISLGTLTKDINAVDFSLRVVKKRP